MTARAHWNIPTVSAALELAEELLAKGLTVAVATANAAPFAMLVNRFGDRFLTIETGRLGAPHGRGSESWVDAASDVDALLVVSDTSGRHGAFGTGGAAPAA